MFRESAIKGVPEPPRRRELGRGEHRRLGGHNGKTQTGKTDIGGDKSVSEHIVDFFLSNVGGCEGFTLSLFAS